eukprot:gene17739-17955_t
MTDPRHIPVLREEALAALNLHDGGTYLDGTFGAGGYTRQMLALPGTRVIALDRDPDAIRNGQAMVAEFSGRLALIQSHFSAMEQVCHEKLDGIVLDIGVSSMQIDEEQRGFSLRFDGPLDMRMDQSGRSAADIVNNASDEELADIFFHFGEERASRRIARAIVHDRQTTPFTTTLQLASMIGRVMPGKPHEMHPATRTFQALRIAVNDELGELVRALEAAERLLKPDGVLSVVTFHSLEDRIVKQFFAQRSGRGAAQSRHLPGEPVAIPPTFLLKGKQPVAPGEAEISVNPRARSAKLRFGIRTGAPSRSADAIMWRLLHIVAIAALVASASYAYSIKYETMWYAEQVVIARNAIAKEHDAIAQLRAEWANLSRPERIQELADRYLDLKPLNLYQIVRPRDLPEIAPKIDVIGSTIDALIAAPTPTTPSSTHGNAATPASLSAPISPTPTGAAAAKTRPLQGLFSTQLSSGPGRIRFLAFLFFLLFGTITGKLIYLGMRPEAPQTLKSAASDALSGARPDIIDRNGDILATDVKVMSIFAEPRRIIDKDEAVELLTAVLPDVNAKDLRDRIDSKKGFVWIKRAVTAKEQQEVFHLGLPGIGFLPENKRSYPNGPLAAHILGFTNIDNNGIAGMEKYIDDQGLADLHGAGFRLTPEDLKPLQLSIDLKATHVLRDELQAGLVHYRAKSGAGAILDVNTGEVIALASLPDYDPNNPVDALDPNRINRAVVGVYEMGSTFKALTLAMAIDSGKANINSRVDARGQLRYGRFKIHDYHAQNRSLTLPEVFTYSSNIGTARLALMVGVEGHKAFLRKAGQLDRMKTELPESAEPIVPKNWGELNTITIAFGHGIAVAPLQAEMAVAALVNGGTMIVPTFLKRTEEEAKRGAPVIVRPETSESLRYIMRLNADIGSAKKADIPGYFVGGKTGTAEKVINGHYSRDRLFTTFMAMTPSDKPKYLFMVVYDEPQGLPETHGFATAAWNAGTVTGRIIERAAPILGLAPRIDLPTQPFPLLARLGIGMKTQAPGTTPR